MAIWLTPRLTPAKSSGIPALRLVSHFMAAASAAFALFILLSTCWTVALTHTVLPHWDEWYSLALFRNLLGGSDLLQGMASAHNEHRILFPRLVIFSDYLVFHGLGIADAVAILLIQVLQATLLIMLLGRTGVDRASRVALGGVVVALTFSLRQGENFAWGFQVQFVGVFACASLGIVLFTAGLDARERGRRASGLLGLAFGLAAVATFSMSNGLLSGVVFVVLACLTRARPAIIAAAVVVAVLTLFAFAAGYDVAARHDTLTEALHRPLGVVTYMAGYLGNFVDNGSLASAVALGTFGLAGLAGLVIHLATDRARNPARVALLGLALFAAGSACLTSLGRSADGLDGAMASRYATGAALFWSALLLAAWSVPARPAVRMAVRTGVCAASAVLFWACWAAQGFATTNLTQTAVKIGAVEDGLMQDLYDEPALDALDEPVGKVCEMLPFLRRRRLSIFAGRDADLIGRPLSDAGTLAPTRCAGSFALAASRPILGVDGVAATGMSSVGTRLGTPARIYIADAKGRIVGLGRTGFGQGPWTGSARAAPRSTLTAYALMGSGRLCSLGTAEVSQAGIAATATTPVSPAASPP